MLTASGDASHIHYSKHGHREQGQNVCTSKDRVIISSVKFSHSEKIKCKSRKTVHKVKQSNTVYSDALSLE